MSIVASERHTVSCTVGGREIRFETGHLAKQADGAVVVRSGDTMVLATAQGRLEGREGADFFPLTVDVEERMYAAGKIPGGFFKREGRPTERAILTARMIDRPIRPLWPKGFKNEVQVIATILSTDQVVAHDVLAINGASAALMISSLPFLGPVGAVRIGMDADGRLIVDPTLPELEESRLDLLVVGTKRRDHDGRMRRRRDSGGHDPRGARARPPRDPGASARRRRSCAAPPASPSCSTRGRHRELEERHGRRIRERIDAEGLREGQTIVEELEAELCPADLDGLDRGRTWRRRTQIRAGLAQLLEQAAPGRVIEPVRAAVRRTSCARSPTPSRTRRS